MKLVTNCIIIKQTITLFTTIDKWSNIKRPLIYCYKM